MNRLRMIVSESLRSLGANLSTTIAATMTVLIAMFLLGVIVGLGSWVWDWKDKTESEFVVKAYFCTDLTCDREATAAEIDAFRVQLERMREVKSVKFVSKEEALQIMRERNPDLVENITSNPLPHAFEITPNNPRDVLSLAERLERNLPPGVEKVDDEKEKKRTVLNVLYVIGVVFLIAVIVLIVVSALLIANTIRLSLFARRREIEVMKLVGATNWFVRGPFMLEGVICGALGATAAVLLLLLGKELALPSIAGRVLENSTADAWPFPIVALGLIVLGLLLGALGSGVTLRRFLQV